MFQIRSLVVPTVITFIAVISFGYLGWVASNTPLPTPSPSPTPSPTPTPVPVAPVDLSRVVPLIGRDGMGHGCPVRPGVILTAAHVVSEGTDAHPIFFSLPSGKASVAMPYKVATYEDIASLVAMIDVDPYPLAKEAPIPGEKLWWVGYNFSTRAQALEPLTFQGTLLRVVGSHLVIDEPPISGSSGSCIINERGEVVGIVTWRVPTDEYKPVLIGPGVWGDLTKPLFVGADAALKEARTGN